MRRYGSLININPSTQKERPLLPLSVFPCTILEYKPIQIIIKVALSRRHFIGSLTFNFLSHIFKYKRLCAY